MGSSARQRADIVEFSSINQLVGENLRRSSLDVATDLRTSEARLQLEAHRGISQLVAQSSFTSSSSKQYLHYFAGRSSYPPCHPLRAGTTSDPQRPCERKAQPLPETTPPSPHSRAAETNVHPQVRPSSSSPAPLHKSRHNPHRSGHPPAPRPGLRSTAKPAPPRSASPHGAAPRYRFRDTEPSSFAHKPSPTRSSHS